MEHSASHAGDRFLQQATDATTGQVDGLAGFWKLGAGRALTLHAAQSGVLRIAHGRVWATFDAASLDAQVRAGDHFLSRGESLMLQAGESLVMESFSGGHARARRTQQLGRALLPVQRHRDFYQQPRGTAQVPGGRNPQVGKDHQGGGHRARVSTIAWAGTAGFNYS